MALRQVSRSLVTAGRASRQTPSVVSLRQQHTSTATVNTNILASSKPPLRSDYSKDACDTRRAWVEARTDTNLRHLGQWLEDVDTKVMEGNIEMPMGLVKLPVACVGPLIVHGEHAEGEFIGPMATTEGALTASMQRGVNAVNAGSGVITRTGKQFCSRAPCFVTKSAAQAQALGKWVKSKKQELQDEVVSKVSSHAKLEDVMPVYDFEATHIAFLFSTGDACGQNVSTMCAWNIIDWVLNNMEQDIPQVDVTKAWIEANATSDKKGGAFNILHGRGMSTEAKVILPEDVLNKYLNVTSDDYLSFLHYVERMSLRHIPGGGIHLNPGNTLTALFIATGQDPACISESIAGSNFTATKNPGEEGGVTATLTLQNLLVGTIGGGVALPTQRECLEIMDCYGAGKVRKFAEIATAFALSLDLSSSSAVVCGKFATGHNKYGRNRPT